MAAKARRTTCTISQSRCSLAFLSLLLILLLVLVEVGVPYYAHRGLGMTREWVYSLLFLSLLGSHINIPEFQLPPEHVASGGQVTFFGVT
jgi:uncharacterized membrane protein